MAIFSTQSIRARTWSEEGAIETLKQLFPSITTRRSSSSSAPESLLSTCVDDDRESMQLPDRMLPESSSSSRPQARSRASSLSKLGGTWLASTADAGRKRARSLLARGATSKTTR